MKKYNINRLSFILLLFVVSISFMHAQETDDELDARRQQRKNLVIKEYNSDAKEKTQWLDHVTIYNEKGLKVEDTEYTRYGLKEKVVFKYDNNDLCVQQIIYDEREKVKIIRKFEYNADRTKKKQYNYLPNGRLSTTKVFQYTR